MDSRHRFPREIISHCVWLYDTFPLSYRDIEKMMLYRGIEVTYETIREWCQKFGQQYANQLRRKRPYLTDKWHLDEGVVMNTRSVCQRQQKAAILFVAGSRLRRKCAGGPTATASGYKGSQTILSQTAEKTRLRATGHRDG
jgi:transposase-like protein